MRFWPWQKQSASEGSTAIQANRDVVINHGVSVSEVRQIFMDLFRANLLEYRGISQNVAHARSEQITEKFLTKLQGENPEGLLQAQTPGFQEDVFTAQKEFAKVGEEELGDLLVDLLVDRSKQTERNTLQIVLSESLRVAPKLTTAQTNTLSIIFLLRYVRFNPGNASLLAASLTLHLGHVVENFAVSESTFNHLAFTGCGAISLGTVEFQNIFPTVYRGLFQKGVDLARIESAALSPTLRAKYVMSCLGNPAKLQINAVGDPHLNDICKADNVIDGDVVKLKDLFNEGTLPIDEILLSARQLTPFMPKLIDAWQSTKMKNTELSSVGMAIAHANIKRFTGEFAPLSIWINDATGGV